MRRIFLVHWNEEEARSYAAGLESQGYSVDIEFDDGANAYKRIKNSLPSAVIIYLTRLPSHGRETALALCTTQSLCRIPIIFAGGKPKVVEQVKPLFPDAVFAPPDDVPEVVSALLSGG